MSKFKAESKKRIIYTNDPYDFNEEDMRESWLESAEANNWDIPEDGPSDIQLWDEWYDQKERDWDDIESEVKYHNEKGSYLIIASNARVIISSRDFCLSSIDITTLENLESATVAIAVAFLPIVFAI